MNECYTGRTDKKIQKEDENLNLFKKWINFY